MFDIIYSALNEIIVVIVPAPAINGNARGTIEVDFDPAASLRNKVIPNTISNPIRKIIIAPAIAKELTSIPNNVNMDSPRKRNANIIIPATIVAFPDCIFPALALKSIITGIEPIISMIENRIIVTEAISLKFTIIRN